MGEKEKGAKKLVLCDQFKPLTLTLNLLSFVPTPPLFHVSMNVIRNQLPQPFHNTTMVAVPKVVIAGGGIVGTSIAYFLAPADVELVLVDPVGIAPAASAKAGGFLARTWRDGTVLQDMQRRGFALHQELANELGADRIDYRRLSCYSVAVGRQGPAHPSEVKWADLNVRDCTSMGQPEDIAQVHPRKLCQTLWNETVQRSPTATLRQGRIVKALTDSNDGSSKAVTGVQLDDGSTLDADVLVCACGPWTHEAQTWFNDDNDDNAKAAHSSTSILPTITSVKCHSMLVANPEPLDQAVFFTSLDADLLDPEADVEVYPRPDGDCYVNGFPDEEGIISEQPGQEEVVDDEIALLQQAMERTSSILGQMEPHTTQVNRHCLVGGTQLLDGEVTVSFLTFNFHVPGLLLARKSRWITLYWTDSGYFGSIHGNGTFRLGYSAGTHYGQGHGRANFEW